MSAREILAAAHARMTPADIAAQALLMAAIVESQDGLIRSLFDTLAKCEGLVGTCTRTLSETSTLLRRAQSLNVANRKREARTLIAELAAVLPATLPEAPPWPSRDLYIEVMPEFFDPPPGLAEAVAAQEGTPA